MGRAARKTNCQTRGNSGGMCSAALRQVAAKWMESRVGGGETGCATGNAKVARFNGEK